MLSATTAEQNPSPFHPYRISGSSAPVRAIAASATGARPLQAIEAADAERARLARDLHDGPQQRLVHTVMTLKLAQAALERGDGSAEALVSEALEQARQANNALRDLAHGAMPAVMRHSGLRAAVEALAQGAPLPVATDVLAERLDRTIEVHSYFIVAEALTNLVKHAHATAAEIQWP